MHDKIKQPRLTRCAVATLLALAACGSQWVHAADQDIPAAGVVAEDPWKVEVFYENDTHRRGKDNTGKTVGLSKFRNTLQAEADKKLSDGWAFHGVLRGTYDGVYSLNSSQFGKDAGGAISVENVAGGPGLAAAVAGYTAALTAAGGAPGNPLLNGNPLTPNTNFGTPVDYLAWVQKNNPGNPLVNSSSVPLGMGIGSLKYGAYPLAVAGPSNGYLNFGANATANTNVGLRVLGDAWHNTNGGVAFAVPVRPCNVDSRGCRDFGGYGNLNEAELASPEFNSRLDFLREAYVTKTYTLDDGKGLFVKLGKQQVVWGRTDLFRVLDVINPVDYSRNNIYDELQDIRIPMWIAQAEYRMGASESMQDRNLQFIFNFDQFRPNNLGQCGTPNVILDAGCFFRGMANLWDNGGTVANFANGTSATDFGPHQIGIRNVDLPKWSLENAQIGAKFEGVSKDGLAFSLNALYYRSQLPSIRAMTTGANNPFFPAPGTTALQTAANTNLIAFDMVYPRISMVGGSLDFQSEALGAAFRVEGAYTHGEEFANTARAQLYSSNNVFRGVLGIDRPTFVPFINANRTTLFSAQMFWQHIFNHELTQGPLGDVGMPDWKDDFIGTLLIKGFLMNDRLSPQIIFARDFKAHAFAVAPSVDWMFTNNLKLSIGANYKGANTDSWKFDDCRTCNPYAPYTGTQAIGQSLGLSGMEPLGRFRAGPIGAAFKENEIFFSLRYKF